MRKGSNATNTNQPRSNPAPVIDVTDPLSCVTEKYFGFPLDAYRAVTQDPKVMESILGPVNRAAITKLKASGKQEQVKSELVQTLDTIPVSDLVRMLLTKKITLGELNMLEIDNAQATKIHEAMQSVYPNSSSKKTIDGCLQRPGVWKQMKERVLNLFISTIDSNKVTDMAKKFSAGNIKLDTWKDQKISFKSDKKEIAEQSLMKTRQSLYPTANTKTAINAQHTSNLKAWITHMLTNYTIPSYPSKKTETENRIHRLGDKQIPLDGYIDNVIIEWVQTLIIKYILKKQSPNVNTQVYKNMGKADIESDCDMTVVIYDKTKSTLVYVPISAKITSNPQTKQSAKENAKKEYAYPDTNTFLRTKYHASMESSTHERRVYFFNPERFYQIAGGFLSKIIVDGGSDNEGVLARIIDGVVHTESIIQNTPSTVLSDLGAEYTVFE